MKVKNGVVELPIVCRILGYKNEDKVWAAHCLEMDIVGYGSDFESALKALSELIAMQFSFAMYKKQPELLDRPTPIHIIEAYQNLYRESLQRMTASVSANKD